MTTIEGESKRIENFIGDMPFGITIEAIQTSANEMEGELAEINAGLAEEGVPENLRKSYERRKAEIEGFLSVSSDEIFHSLQEVYDFVHQMEADGIEKGNILSKMTEKPELVQAVLKFYGILRSQTWGYSLGQTLLAFKAERPKI